MSEKTIKAITLYQPWASLVAIGAKTIETRSWSTNYRGELAIHAGMNDRSMKLIAEPPFSDVFGGVNRVFPFGQVVAVCKLRDCALIPSVEEGAYIRRWMRISEMKKMSVWIPPTSPELEFGDYTPGRYAWILDEVRMLKNPIAVTGHQRLWNFTFDEVL